MSDYYQLLGVARDAGADEIKSAYRKLALKFHPDRNPGDRDAEEKFKAINEAYAVLSDPEKRSRFDRFGSADAGGQLGGDIFDIFNSVFGANFGGNFGGNFGAQGRASRRQQGEDLETELEITLAQAREGASVPLELNRYTTCDRCHGERADPEGRPAQSCPTCGGVGQVRAQAQSLFGTVVTARPCPQCRGAGETIPDPCRSCQGRGRVEERARVDVELPRGIDGGYRLRIPQQGNVGLFGGPPGDLYVYISMREHPHFRRDGDDLHYDLEVGMAQAALGSSFEVPTLDAPEVVDVPAGTQPGTQVRLRGKGMPRLRRVGTGDLVVTVRVAVPERLSKRARELLLAYADEVGEPIHEKETLLARLKGMFGKKKERESAEA